MSLLFDTLVELDVIELGYGKPLDLLFQGFSFERALEAAKAAGYSAEQARSQLGEVYSTERDDVLRFKKDREAELGAGT